MVSVLGWVMVGLSAVAIAVAVLFARREARIRVTIDLIRLLLGAGVIVFFSRVAGVGTPSWLAAGAAGMGVVLGFIEGRNFRVRVAGKRLYARRGAAATAVWGIGLLVAQGGRYWPGPARYESVWRCLCWPSA